MGVTIRPATHKDEASLFALASVFPTPTPPGFETFREILRVKLADPRSAILVADSDGRLVGYASGLCHAPFYERLGDSSKAGYFKKYLGTAPL
jgi:hypothetical protein